MRTRNHWFVARPREAGRGAIVGKNDMPDGVVDWPRHKTHVAVLACECATFGRRVECGRQCTGLASPVGLGSDVPHECVVLLGGRSICGHRKLTACGDAVGAHIAIVVDALHPHESFSDPRQHGLRALCLRAFVVISQIVRFFPNFLKLLF